MTPPTNAQKICPHCGAHKKKSAVPTHLISSVLILAAALFLWEARRAGSNGSGQAQTPGRLSEKVTEYIAGATDEPCRSCLAAADKFINEQKTAAMNEKTKGMALVPAGEYSVGSPENAGDPDEHPQRRIFLDAFYIDKNETTIAEYMRFARGASANYPEWDQPGGKFNIETGRDGYYKPLTALLKTCADCPVIGVSARDAEAYCGSRNKRLPTEAEWEASARSGSDAKFHFGDDPSAAGDHAWLEGNSDGTPHPVGQKKPNGYGLHDMHGNVWEWTADLYADDYYQQGSRRNPKGPETGREHVIRGGSWAFDMDAARSANRASSGKANDDIGFRCAVSESGAASVLPGK